MPTTAIRVPVLRVRLGRLDDERLAALAAEGDERAFETIYDRHHRALLGFCRHFLGSHHEAEDALQQTFLRAHRALLSKGAPEELRPWLFTIARNRCRTIFATRKAEVETHDGLEATGDGLAVEAERRADLDALVRDVGRLPEDQRSALVLAELADMPHAEIAAVIGVPQAKVKALVHQARSRLIADREARDTPCELIREELSTARGGVLRRGPLRRHLATCDACSAFRAKVADQRRALAMVLPVLPSAGLKSAVLGAISGGGGAGTAAAVGGGAAAGAGGAGLGAGGGSLGLMAKGLGTKLAIGAALATGGGGTAAVIEHEISEPERSARVQAGAGAPGAVTTPVAAGTAPVAAPLVEAVDGDGAAARSGAPAAPLRGERRERRASGVADERVGRQNRSSEKAGHESGPKGKRQPGSKTGRDRAVKRENPSSDRKQSAGSVGQERRADKPVTPRRKAAKPTPVAAKPESRPATPRYGVGRRSAPLPDRSKSQRAVPAVPTEPAPATDTTDSGEATVPAQVEPSS
jgi:RNA polymerase sigma factor (sigma-70 family)